MRFYKGFKALGKQCKGNRSSEANKSWEKVSSKELNQRNLPAVDKTRGPTHSDKEGNTIKLPGKLDTN